LPICFNFSASVKKAQLKVRRPESLCKLLSVHMLIYLTCVGTVTFLSQMELDSAAKKVMAGLS